MDVQRETKLIAISEILSFVESKEKHYETDKPIGKIFTQIDKFILTCVAKLFVLMFLSFHYFSTLMLNSVMKLQWRHSVKIIVISLQN